MLCGKPCLMFISFSDSRRGEKGGKMQFMSEIRMFWISVICPHHYATGAPHA